MKDKVDVLKSSETGWKNLFRIGGFAGMVAGILFRRNIGAEISLFSSQKPPAAIDGWLSLLQSNRFLGLAYLNVFDILNYILIGLMFLALFVALREYAKSQVGIAVFFGFLGIVVYLASNTAFSMLAISDQYALTVDESQRGLLLSAGQALLAINRFSSGGAHPGSGGYLSLLLIAFGGILISITMLQSGIFKKAIAWFGFLANALDLAYCFSMPFVPQSISETLAVLLIPAAGLMFMVWHILAGWSLFKLGSSPGKG